MKIEKYKYGLTEDGKGNILIMLCAVWMIVYWLTYSGLVGPDEAISATDSETEFGEKIGSYSALPLLARIAGYFLLVRSQSLVWKFLIFDLFVSAAVLGAI